MDPRFMYGGGAGGGGGGGDDGGAAGGFDPSQYGAALQYESKLDFDFQFFIEEDSSSSGSF